MNISTNITKDKADEFFFVSVTADCENVIDDVIAAVNSTLYGVDIKKQKLTACVREENTIPEVGSFRKAKLNNGKEIELLCVKNEDDGDIYITYNILGESRMNQNESTDGGYEKSEMCQTLKNKYLPMFPEELVRQMIPFENGDLLRLPKKEEIFDLKNEKQWKPMKNKRNVIALDANGDTSWWWLQDVSSSINFCHVTDYGYALAYSSSDALGVRPAIKLNRAQQ